MLVLEDGPWNVWDKLRAATGIKYLEDGVVYYPSWNALHCVWCTSVWMAGLVWLGGIVCYWLVWMLALSAIACLIEEWFGNKS